MRVDMTMTIAVAMAISIGCASAPSVEDPAAGVPSIVESETVELAKEDTITLEDTVTLQRHLLKTDSGRDVQLVEWVREERPQDRATVVLFVHGSPGGWSAAGDVFAEIGSRKDVRLLSIDRLGWGGSAEGGVEPSLAAQAEAVATCLRWASPLGGAILIGHSLGGPVVARAAMDYPELVQGLVVLAGSVDPKLEKTTWYQAASRWWWIRWMVPEALRRSDAEIRGLRSELQAMMPLWSDLKLLVTIVHGEKDSLVPVANVDFLVEELSGASVEVHRIKKRGHFVPWKEAPLIAGSIIGMVERLSGSKPLNGGLVEGKLSGDGLRK